MLKRKTKFVSLLMSASILLSPIMSVSLIAAEAKKEQQTHSFGKTILTTTGKIALVPVKFSWYMIKCNLDLLKTVTIDSALVLTYRLIAYRK